MRQRRLPRTAGARHDPLARDPHLQPCLDRIGVRAKGELVVAAEHRDPDVLLAQAEALAAEVPGEAHGLGWHGQPAAVAHDPTGGVITVDGVPLVELRAAEWQRRVAVVFQDFVRYPLSASANVGFGAVEWMSKARAFDRLLLGRRRRSHRRCACRLAGGVCR